MDDEPSSDFKGSRLALARKLRQMTVKQLSKESGITERTVSRLERGENLEPQTGTVNKLADALNVKVNFFYLDDPDEIHQKSVSFRRSSRVSTRASNSALASATIAIELFSEVGNHFDLLASDVPILEGQDPGFAAELVRAEWGLGDRPIHDLLRLLESKGVRILSIPNVADHIDAFCFRRDLDCYILLNTNKTAERIRFDLAHELGHLVLHSSDDLSSLDNKKQEKEANQFAASFLMPSARVVQQRLKNASLETVLTVKKYWGVSAAAMAFRIKELNIISEWQYRSLMVKLNRLGYMNGEPDGLPKEQSTFIRVVFYRSESRISLKSTAEKIGLEKSAIVDFIRGLLPVVD